MPPSVARTAPTPRSTSWRAAAAVGGGVGLELVGVAAGEGGELLAVGLHQVGRRRRASAVDERVQRAPRWCRPRPGRRPRAGGDELGVPAAGRPGAASRPAPSSRRRRRGPAAAWASSSRCSGATVGAGGVELGGGAVGLGDGEVDADVAGGAHRAAVDAGGEQLEDERVVVGGGEHGDGGDAGADGGAGDVDALAAGLRGHRRDAVHLAAARARRRARPCGRCSGWGSG